MIRLIKFRVVISWKRNDFSLFQSFTNENRHQNRFSLSAFRRLPCKHKSLVVKQTCCELERSEIWNKDWLHCTIVERALYLNLDIFRLNFRVDFNCWWQRICRDANRQTDFTRIDNSCRMNLATVLQSFRWLSQCWESLGSIIKLKMSTVFLRLHQINQILSKFTSHCTQASWQQRTSQ